MEAMGSPQPMRIGYFLTCEDHTVDELLDVAAQAEDAGFTDFWISDHFHPWTDRQGNSAFVWSVIGAIAGRAASDITVTTAVTCPTTRIHPAIVAQAAATSACLLPGRFKLGVGTGENLNEHVLGDHWPPAEVRLAMLEEAVDVMRQLWTGETVTHHGEHYVVERARLYTLPEEPPPVLVSAFGPKAADAAATFADGFITTKPDHENLTRYRDAGGKGMAQAGMKACFAPSVDEAATLIHEIWPTGGLSGGSARSFRCPLTSSRPSRTSRPSSSRRRRRADPILSRTPAR